MNGIHDMGGMHGFGPVMREEDEPLFHAPWEARVMAIDEIVEGDTVREVLHYVQYDATRLAMDIRKEVERAVRSKVMTAAESHALVKAYEAGLAGYTYLECESHLD